MLENLIKTIPVVHSLRQLKRKKWSAVAYQEIDFDSGIWHWHLGADDQTLLWAAEGIGLLKVAQRKMGDGCYRLVAMTTLEWERGARP